MKRAVTAALALLLAAAAHAQPTPPAAQPLRVSITGDLGYVAASGNSSFENASLGDRFGLGTDQWSFTQTARYVQGSVGGSEDAEQLQLGLRYDHAVTRRFNVFVAAADDRNTFAGFRARLDQSLGVDFRELESAHDSLSLDLGATYTEEFDDDRTRTSYPAARLAANYKHVFGESTYFTLAVELIPDVADNTSRRINSQSAIVAPITRRIALKVNYDVRYESRPPTGYGTTDRMLTTGIQVSY